MLQITETKVQDQNKVKISLENSTETTRLHVFASHFFPTDFRHSLLSLLKLFKKRGESESHFFDEWKNSYLSNRELSKELRYVFDRRQAERYQGNTLDRPKLLMKRQFVYTTLVDDGDHASFNIKVKTLTGKEQNLSVDAKTTGL